MMIMGIGRCNLGLVISLENGDWFFSIYCWCMHVDVTFHGSYVIGCLKMHLDYVGRINAKELGLEKIAEV